MKIDSQGRTSLGKTLCEELDYCPGMVVRFVMEDDRTYRITPKENIAICDKVASSDVVIDKNYRIFVPQEIRDLYGTSVLIYAKQDVSFLYLKFMQNKENENLISAIDTLTSAVQKLIEKL